MQLTFTRDIVAADASGKNRRYRAGQVIEEKDILPGCLQSCLQNGTIVTVKPEPVKPETAKPATAKSAKQTK